MAGPFCISYLVGRKLHRLLRPLVLLLLLLVSAAPLLCQPLALSVPVRVATEKPKLYQISAVLSPEQLRRRGIAESTIAAMRKRCALYVAHFAHVARTEQLKYGIPASITLGQALLESDAGQTRLARDFRNHFGIKCFASVCADKHCAPHEDDHPTDFFRTFESNWTSFRAHSEFLQKPRYAACFSLHPQDYRGWAYALQRAGYATDKAYAVKLIRLIEALELYQYD